MKTTITTIIVFILIITGLYFLYTSDFIKDYLNKTTDDVLEPAPLEVVENQEFEPFTKFLRADLTDDEKNNLRFILKDREGGLKLIEDILSKEFEKESADMAMAFMEVAQIREDIKSTIMPYIDPDKITDFDEKYRELGQEIESRYVTK
jgi:hypothetical protein